MQKSINEGTPRVACNSYGMAVVRKLCLMKPGWLDVKTLPDEAWCGNFAWVALLWRLCPMRPGVEVVPGKACLASVWKLCLIRSGVEFLLVKVLPDEA